MKHSCIFFFVSIFLSVPVYSWAQAINLDSGVADSSSNLVVNGVEDISITLGHALDAPELQWATTPANP